ncbi:hypothetical protein [Parapedobacter sp. DT-150]|uniref:hypothetical protein n=1 Tax=Parapedobacter sp. DT-150 TaxID=3396162 RepID=UPI003F1CC96B
MNAIDKRKHRVLVEALDRLHQLLVNEAGDTGCIIPVLAASSGKDKIEVLYGRYAALLDELERAITEYEQVYRHLRVSVIGTGLRGLRRVVPPGSDTQHLLRAAIDTAKAV